MKRIDSINNLKKLYLLLNDLMGDSSIGVKYVRSLKNGIKSLEKNRLSVENESFKVNVNNNKGKITINIKTLSGELIESHCYSSDDVVSDKIVGKT